MRVTLLHQPGAGDAHQPDADALQALLRDAGHTVHYRSVDDAGWDDALDTPADLVAVAGGDGTVGRVARRAAGRDIAIAPLPMGTANNIARTLGLAELPLAAIVEGWRKGRRVRFDVGVATGPWGTRRFVEAFGIGLFACAIPVADRSRRLEAMRHAEDRVAYAQAIVQSRVDACPVQRLALRVDGEAIVGDYVLVEAMNMAFVGPNLHLAPRVASSDGALDLVLVTHADRDRLQQALDAEGGTPPPLARRLARRVEIEWTGYDVHLDDDVWPGDGERPAAAARIEIGVEPEALLFWAPVEAPALHQ